MINFDLVIDKIKKVKGLSKDAEVAKLLGLSPPDFSARKKKGTILPLIVDWAVNENVNLDSLLKNDGEVIYIEAKTTETGAGGVAEEQIKQYVAGLPEPISKAVQVMLKNQEKAWEFYAMILERIEKIEDKN